MAPNNYRELSIVIPAYNESLRLPPFLAAARNWLDANYPGRYEVIVVDDGSTDDLVRGLGALHSNWPEMACIRHRRNRGKGAALRTGLLASVGTLLLIADADGTAPIEAAAN